MMPVGPLKNIYFTLAQHCLLEIYIEKVGLRSFTEAEYKALANVVAELMWIKSLLKELGISNNQAPNLIL